MSYISEIEVLEKCQDLGFLNQFINCLRETEYRVLLIICGHTKHGQINPSQIKIFMSEYWQTLDKPSHVKNYTYILHQAIKKISMECILRGFT